MNYHEVIRSLVVDGQMAFSEVLDLTPYQLAALGTKESDSPGEVSLEKWKKLAGSGGKLKGVRHGKLPTG
jgi:hypothetical protein